MFCKTSYLRKTVRAACWIIFNKVENNDNADLYKNGESLFIRNLFRYYSEKGKRNLVIFDVGANFGQYSDILVQNAQNFGIDIDLHLFEPQEKCVQLLKDKYKKMNVNQVAVSDEEGESYIFYDKERSSFANLFGEGEKFEKVKLIRLDTYIKERNIKHCDFLKIDVEGNELKVIRGLGEFLNVDFLDFLQFEYGGTYIRSHSTLFDVYKILEDRGFVIFKIMPGGLEWRKYKNYMENFSYQNFVAISQVVYKDLLSKFSK